ncbi:DUF2848 domain-containing protein [Burkholderia ubonensis]|nr:DUF2848 domain-containing protein [Burkholderia ubonensis]ODQ37650.1 hypothetical protein BGV63_15910 [Burkholderia ubonensis]OJA28598.1 hypothetical protein BGV58_14410 [Burkholderia ubonensis]OJB64080.1 hypothetical protein BGV62_15935 [Burkholderia ubonensis]
MKFTCQNAARIPVTVPPTDLVIAGWTGRDAENVRRHIDELEAIGIAGPTATPTFYRVAPSLLTTESRIDVVGPNSTGEAEYCIFSTNGREYITVGSDHTDRELERFDVTLSKQVCAKPVSTQCWLMDEVDAHWDQLILQSHATQAGNARLYQRATLDALLPPRELLAGMRSPLEDGSFLFGGTIPVIGELQGAESFRVELIDPVLNRVLTCEYRINILTEA